MTKKVIAIMLGMLSVGAGMELSARQLTPTEALENARSSQGMRKAKGASTIEATPAYTASCQDLNTLYIFNNASGNGYVIVAADDVAAPVLGYSDSGSFDPANIPANMADWLSIYSEEIAAASNAGSPRYMPTIRRENREAVAPLVTTKWNQSTPFNNNCPVIDGKQTVTGCSATCLAQIMNYWKYPAKGQGSNSYTYTSNIDNLSHTASLDFSTVTFKWDKMIDNYNISYTSAEAAAVAELMYTVGVSMNSTYGTSTGASATNAYKAAINFFNYAPTAKCISRSWYKIDDWNELVYNEVASGRPVYYTGHNAGGHAFVCDGYSSDNYFHINWGWGGSSDGYFLLTALDPKWQGIGGSDAGYNGSQTIIVGIQPSAEGLNADPMIYAQSFVPAADSYGKSATVVINGGFYSRTPVATEIRLGVKMINTTTGEVSYVQSTSYDAALNLNYGWKSMSIPGSRFSVGTYLMSPAFMSNNVWYDMLYPIGMGCQKIATITSSTITFETAPGSEANLTCTDFKLLSPIYIGTSTSLAVTVESDGDFYGNITPYIFDIDNGSAVLLGVMDYKTLSMSPGEKNTYTWIGTFANYNKDNPLTDGAHYLGLLNENTGYFEIYGSVTVNSATSVTKPSYQSLACHSAFSGTGTQSNPWIFNPNELQQFTLKIKGTCPYWADVLKVGIFDATTHKSITFIGSEFGCIEGSVVKSFAVEGLVPAALEDQTTYWICGWSNNSGQLSNVYYAKSDFSLTGIEGVSTDTGLELALFPNPAESTVNIVNLDADALVSIYSLQGSLVKAIGVSADGASIDVSDLAAGHYVVSIARADGSIVVKRLIKR